MKSIAILLVCMIVMAATEPTDKTDESDMAELTKDQRVCIADHIRADDAIFSGLNIFQATFFYTNSVMSNDFSF
jgi:hypothetical protein